MLGSGGSHQRTARISGNLEMQKLPAQGRELMAAKVTYKVTSKYKQLAVRKITAVTTSKNTISRLRLLLVYFFPLAFSFINKIHDCEGQEKGLIIIGLARNN